MYKNTTFTKVFSGNNFYLFWNRRNA